MNSLDPSLLHRLAAKSRSYAEKIAKVHTELQPHQKRVVERIQREDQPGLLVAHGLGSGKTLTSIAAQDALNLPADVVVPASLRANFAKELKKHRKGKLKTDIQSMQNVATKGSVPEKDMLIVDEAHRARDPASKTYKVLKKTKAKKRLLLSGTPFYNRPSDISSLINLAAGQNVLPQEQKEFEKKYVALEKVNPGMMARLRGVKPGIRTGLNPKKAEELGKILQKWVDYHEGSKENFPEVERQDVKVPMEEKQQEVYDALMGKAPLWVRYKVQKGLPPTKQESQQLNAFLGAVRQVSNTTAPYVTKDKPNDPKIQRAYEELKKNLDSNPRAKAVVYSNYLGAGLDPYKKRLSDAKIPYGEFTGQMPKAERDELVKQYNAGKIRALLLSSAGGEGLDLKGTRLMQILEPHWNQEKLRQVEGRGIRYKSHEELAPEERKVLVQRYLSTRKPAGVLQKLRFSKPGYSVDEYLTQMSAEKNRLNDQFRDLLRKQQAQV